MLIDFSPLMFEGLSFTWIFYKINSKIELYIALQNVLR